MKPFYVTTPIYYVNDRPHIGTAYSTVAADVLARYQRLRGRPTRFLTGLDEHGVKVERRARELGLEPKTFVDKMAAPFQDAWKTLRCSHDDFIRTTEPRHKERAQRMWQRLVDAGDIYLGEYEGWYSASSEAFLTDKDLLPGNLDPISKKPVERVREKSYFFRLSRYTERLLDFYEAHPDFVRPEGRYNEVKSFVREGLRDLSVSRTSFRWGIPVPGDEAHVMYVWLDALTNYISALGAPDASGHAPLFDRYWEPSGQVVHIVGKDILRFHAVYWPAFLMSAGLEPPTQVWAHGWLTVDGEKMSKSLGNFIPPEPLIEAFGADTLRYYLMRDIGFGQDGDFSHSNLFARYHGELGNGLGNLLNRMVTSIVGKNLGGRVPAPRPDAADPADQALHETAQRVAQATAEHMHQIAPHRALESIWELVAAANRYVDQTQPWALAKQDQTARLEQSVYTVLEALRWIGVMVWPFMPDKADALMQQLGLEAVRPQEEHDGWPSIWGELPADIATRPAAPLFPRFDKTQEHAILKRIDEVKAQQAMTAANMAPGAGGEGKPTDSGKADSGKANAAKAATETSTISFDDFLKVELRVARIEQAERVPKSDKLLKLQVDLGEPELRQILAGIGKAYAPEQLVGKSVVVVSNLAPRKMMGQVSQGMVLAADVDGGLAVLEPDGSPAPGTRVS